MKQERKTTYNTFAVLFYINRQKVKKNGLCPLMGRISINTEVAQFSTKMEVQPDLWDAGKSSVSCPLKPSDSAPLC